MKNIKARIIADTAASEEETGRLVSDFDLGELDSEEFTVLPGFCEAHAHFREPGFSYKETVRTGSFAAARGGYTAVFTMPNLDPSPDDAEKLKVQLDIIEKDARIAVYPYGTITKGERGETLSDMEETAKNTVAFSDDGRGVQSEETMRAAMEKAKALGKIIVAHCEVNELLRGGYIHDGSYAKAHGHRGICSESEYLQIERDVKLAKETGCAYHVCHISAKESVEIIRKAKKDGVNVTCETAPHYLLLDEGALKEDGRFKMNPPIREKADRLALIEGIKDGTIDMIATDHAPHSKEEKSHGLEGSAFGIVGLETAFPLLYTYLVKEGIITLKKLISLISTNPKKRFNVRNTGFSVWSLKEKYKIDPGEFLSKGKSTPFEGTEVYGRNYLTVYNGKAVYEYLKN